MSRPPSRRRRRGPGGGRAGVLVAGVAAALLGLAAGCGTAPPLSPPAGVDQLTVPTPSPDPDDFADRVDNPWLALRPGEATRFRSSRGGAVVVEVAPEPVAVAGLSATAVRRSVRGDAVVTDYLAQDAAGNVWWVGREGSWEAGTDGAEAGLAMPARPRYGDGWRRALRPGVVEEVAEVVELGEPLTLDETDYAETLVVQVTDPLTGTVRRLTYVRGTGLVLDQPVTAGDAPDPLGALVVEPR